MASTTSDPESDDSQDIARLQNLRDCAVAGGIGARPGDDGDEEDVDIDNNDEIYLTESWREWEKHFLKKVAKRIHRYVCTDLDRFEESLFMLFVTFDDDLDGSVQGDEAERLLQAVENIAPGSSTEAAKMQDRNGNISFVSLIQWFSANDKGKDVSTVFDMSSRAVSMLGSGTIGADGRLDALTWEELRRNVVGYRKLLRQVRELQEDRLLGPSREIETAEGLEQAIPSYHGLLANEFEGDAEHLFELFCEVDDSGNMMLEQEEVEKMLLSLDTGATDADLKRYICEINLADGPLSFASLLDWWDQARNVANSLVAEKGTTLVATVKARAAAAKFSGFLSESSVQKQWRMAKENNYLHALKQSYIRTLSEVREYKMERDLRSAEMESAKM